MRIKDLMTSEVRTVGPDTPLRDVASTLSQSGLSGLPVVDGDGQVIGVISEWDILAKEQGRPDSRGGLLGRLFDADQEWEQEKFEARTASQAMTSPPITVRPIDRVAKAARLMVENGVNRLPVLQDDELVGIVTRADLVRAFTQSDAEIEREIRQDVIERQLWTSATSILVSVENGEVVVQNGVPLVASSGATSVETLVVQTNRLVAIDLRSGATRPVPL
ncbi:MAG: CBS domain-containing protein, partial [Gaiellales bacterium]